MDNSTCQGDIEAGDDKDLGDGDNDVTSSWPSLSLYGPH